MVATVAVASVFRVTWKGHFPRELARGFGVEAIALIQSARERRWRRQALQKRLSMKPTTSWQEGLKPPSRRDGCWRSTASASTTLQTELWLPMNKTIPNPVGAAVHEGLHSPEYYATVNELLTSATSRPQVPSTVSRQYEAPSLQVGYEARLQAICGRGVGVGTSGAR